jgi:hypothetical protein
MKEIIRKLIRLETEIAKERGPFDLFALFSSDEEMEDAWDLAVSATWIGEETIKALEYLTDKLHSHLTAQEFSTIRKIAPLDVYDPMVKDIQKLVTTEHRLKEIDDYRFYGFRVEKMRIITCKLQIDERLMQLMWKIIIKMWKSGNRKIESEEVFKELRNRGKKVGDYAMDRIFEHLLSAKCIRGPQYINSDAVKEHGAMAITWVNPECRATPSISVSA